MFRALTCPSSGGQIVFTQHLVTSLSVNGCTVHRLREDCALNRCTVVYLLTPYILIKFCCVLTYPPYQLRYCNRTQRGWTS